MGASKKRTVKAMMLLMLLMLAIPWQGDCRDGRRRIKCV